MLQRLVRIRVIVSCAIASALAIPSAGLGQTLPACAVPLRVFDVSPAPTRSGLSQSPSMLRMGDFVYFSAFEPTVGWTLWRTNGSFFATTRISTLSTQSLATSTELRMLAAAPGVLYFASNNQTSLWRTDGTDAGTVLLDASATGLDAAILLGDRLIYRTTTEVRTVTPTDTAPTTLTPTLSTATLGNGSNAVILNNRALFALRGPANTSELWATDGAPVGTIRLAQYDGGVNADGVVTRLYVVGNTVLFRAATPATGVEFFQSDGTPEGTSLFHEFLPGPNNYSDTRAIGVADGKLYMNWLTTLAVTDGVTVTNLANEFIVRSPVFGDVLPTINGRTLFSASIAFPNGQVEQTGPEPFVSDGTPGGTGLLAGDFVPGVTGAFEVIGTVARLGDRWCFPVRQPDFSTDLFSTDGTASGTFRLVQGGLLSGGGPMLNERGRLFFTRSTAANGLELWVTDGAIFGTRMVKDIWPGEMSGVPLGLFECPWPIAGSIGLLLAANTPDAGRELWYSDATEATTTLVRDIAGGSISSNVNALGTLGSAALFGSSPSAVLGVLSTTVQFESGLFRWDGSSPGQMIASVASGDPPTALIRTINPLFDTSIGAYFLASNPTPALFITDGTDVGTVRLTAVQNLVNPNTITYSSQQEQNATVARLGDGAMFAGITIMTGAEPTFTDGNPSGAFIVKDIAPGTATSNPSNFTSFFGAPAGARVLFRASAPGAGFEPWVSDGTPDGTLQLADIWPGAGSGLQTTPRDSAPLLVEFNGRAYFYARTGSTGTSTALFSTDATPAGTAPVNTGLSGVTPSDVYALSLCERGVLFWGSALGTGPELYVTDGTPAGSSLVRDIVPGPNGSGPTALTRLGRFAAFSVTAPAQAGLWVTDGSNAGTRQLNLTIAGSDVESVGPGVVGNGRTYFIARTGVGSGALYYVCAFTSTPDDACVLTAINPAFSSSGIPTRLTLINNRLFFPNISPLLGSEPAMLDLCPTDFNNSGGNPTAQDVFDFIEAFFNGDPRADFDSSGSLSIQDVFSFLERWFLGCIVA